MKILAIDPGTTKSGWCIYDTQTRLIPFFGIDENEAMIGIIGSAIFDEAAIEMVACYGMAVGAEVFETCVWVGRFWQVIAPHRPAVKVYRKDCKVHLCGTTKAKDPNIRQAIQDRYGGKDATKKGGPLHGINSHIWPAIAVAITHSERQKKKMHLDPSTNDRIIDESDRATHEEALHTERGVALAMPTPAATATTWAKIEHQEAMEKDPQLLPIGKTCKNCAHLNRCVAKMQIVETSNRCAYAPSRFMLPIWAPAK